MSLARFEHGAVTVDEGDSALVAAQRMRDFRVGSVVVMRRGRAEGILTDRDLVLRVVAEGRDPAGTRAADVMSYLTATVAPGEGIETALGRMREHGVRRLPIVDAAGQVTGLVAADDLIVLLAREISDLGASVAENADASESR
jgi:CBS domain-containing protein